MATRKQKFQVFVFLIVCLALVGLIIYIVSGMYSTTKLKYWVEFDESVLGIYEGEWWSIWEYQWEKLKK